MSGASTLHPVQVLDLAARCGVVGTGAALLEFAALVREAAPLAPDEMRPAPIAGTLTDAQISAGADVLCDCPNPKRIGRNAAIAVFDAMSGAGPAVRSALQCIHDTFKRDLDAGYRTRDKEFAVSVAAEGLRTANPNPEPPTC